MISKSSQKLLDSLGKLRIPEIEQSDAQSSDSKSKLEIENIKMDILCIRF